MRGRTRQAKMTSILAVSLKRREQEKAGYYSDLKWIIDLKTTLLSLLVLHALTSLNDTAQWL